MAYIYSPPASIYIVMDRKRDEILASFTHRGDADDYLRGIDLLDTVHNSGDIAVLEYVSKNVLQQLSR